MGLRTLGVLLSSTIVVLAAALPSAEAGDDVFRKGPYLQNVTKRSVTIMWEAPIESIGTITVMADPPIVVNTKPAQIHEVPIGGLEPGRRYQYKVESEGVTAHGEFATAPAGNSPFSFIVFGDSRSNAASHRRIVERVRREVPDFLLGTGDMVNEGASDSDWQQFFDLEREILAENVLYPSLGNHDRQGRGRTADNYRQYFSIPENSPNPERYYAFTYGNSRFLILDSNSYSFALTDQTAWIEQQLQAARLDKSISHIFVSMHHPPFSVSLHGGQAELREAWTPLFEKYQVAAVFSGHDHVYSRAERNGVRYFVSGGGGAPLYPRRKKATEIDRQATRYFERTNHYLRVHVLDRTIEISVVRADGSLIETIRWGKPRSPTERAARLASLVSNSDTVGAPRVAAAGGPVRGASAGPPDAGKNPSRGKRSGFGIMGFGGLMLAFGAGLVLFRAVRS